MSKFWEQLEVAKHNLNKETTVKKELVYGDKNLKQTGFALGIHEDDFGVRHGFFTPFRGNYHPNSVTQAKSILLMPVLSIAECLKSIVDTCTNLISSVVNLATLDFESFKNDGAKTGYSAVASLYFAASAVKDFFVEMISFITRTSATAVDYFKNCGSKADLMVDSSVAITSQY